MFARNNAPNSAVPRFRKALMVGVLCLLIADISPHLRAY
jgi:hypothetical protein